MTVNDPRPSTVPPIGAAARLAVRLGAAARANLALGSVLGARSRGRPLPWNVTVSGHANTYNAMAAQAGSKDWAAFFFGSLDAASFQGTVRAITADVIILQLADGITITIARDSDTNYYRRADASTPGIPGELAYCSGSLTLPRRPRGAGRRPC
jgi:hypothetical protein